MSAQMETRSSAGRGMLRDVLRLMRMHPWLYIGSTAGVWSMYLFPLIPGVLIKRLFALLADPGAVAEPRTGVWLVAGTLVGVALARSVFALGWPAEKTLIGLVAALLRQNLLRRILQRPGAAPLPEGSSPGEVISRLRDDLQHIGELISWTADPAGQVLAIGVALVTLLRIDVSVALLAMLPIVLIVISVNLLNRRIRQLREANQRSIGTVTGLVGELFGAVQAIKVSGAERNVIAHLARANAIRRSAALRDQLLADVIHYMSFGASHIATSVLLIVGAAALREGRMTVGDLALFASYLGWLTFISGMIGDFVTRVRQVGVSLDRARTLLQGAPADMLVDRAGRMEWPRTKSTAILAPPAADALRTLAVRGLRYQYPNSPNGIGPLDLEIARGEFVVVTGRIGAGKTTLLRALLGLLPATGEWRWNGALITDPAGFLTPPNAAYTPQTPRLFSETLRDNILLGQPDSALSSAVFQAVLEDDIPTLEKGLDTLIGPRGVKLSGGQLQRAAAARMFARTPALLVLDDVSSALDVVTEATLWARLAEQPGRTCLVVSTRRAALRAADRIMLLDGGQVLASGTLDALLETQPAMRALWAGEGA